MRLLNYMIVLMTIVIFNGCGGGSTANAPEVVIESESEINVLENQTFVMTVIANDTDVSDGSALTYSISGEDASLFIIDSLTGVINFKSIPSLSNPLDQDADNIYRFTIEVTDGTNTAIKEFTINLVEVLIVSNSEINVDENQLSVTIISATDTNVLDGDPLSYSKVGGADASLFSVNATTGVVTFNSAPNFESPSDANTDNVYTLDVEATDGTNTATQTLNVTVTDVNDAPVITSGATATVAENIATSTAVYTTTSTDEDAGDTVTYSMTGTDAGSFTMTNGVVTFNVSPDYETKSSYSIDVIATDAGGLTDTETVTISVTDVNEAPVITSGTTATVAENIATSTAVYTTTSTDVDAGDTVTYSMTGTDAGSFTMTNGVVTFNVSPDYETKSSYSIDVIATDAGGLTDTETVTISVTDVNDVAPVITSANAVSVQENQTAVLTVTSSDGDALTQTFSYSLDGGADVALFSVNATTGELTFNSAPDFESPSDANTDNVYVVGVKVNDGVQDSTTQTISVTVMDAGDNVPVITSGTIATIAENTVTSTAVYTTTATDADANDILVYTMAGTDAGSFTMTNGVVKFKVSPDYETKSSYSIDVIVTDLVGFTDTETVTISVTDENDVAPVITSANAVSVQENQTAVLTVTSSDVDTMTQTFSYSKVGGVDGSLFSITSGGVLTFNSAPDFESPSDADADNVYEVSVKVNDGVQDSTTQTISVTVTNVNEAPVITSGTTATIAENTVTSTAVYTTTATDVDAGDTVTYTMGGTDAGSFTITNGVVTFNVSPDYETKSSYSIDVTATDAGGLTDTETVTISVTDVNEAPVITSGATATVAENSPTSTAVYTTTATDEDAGDTVTYSMTGTDAGSFTMTNGVVTFNVSPDYETKSSYSIDVTATDAGGLTDTETVTISVTDENDVAPVITSANAVSVQENQTAVLTVTSSDVDTMTQTFSYSLDGGADVALFSVNATTGELTFNNAPDFESPSDADADNVYEVSVKVNDGVQDSTTQTISVTVMDAGDNVPVITSGTIATIAENTVTSTAVYTTTATDADANDILVYTMAGTDAGSFTMTNGVVKFKVSPDYETKSSYSIDVIVTDLVGFTDTETVTISVTDENDVAPVITSANAVSVQENQTAVLTVTSSDVDTMTQTFSYSKVGGVDGSLFSITSGGVLTFNSAPDFESPSDADADNVYEVSVKVNDGVQDSTTQTISVTVTNVNEAPVITSGTTATIAENTVTSTAVYTTTATDVDAGDTVTYTMGGTDAGSFTITNGVVKFKASPNYETKSSYSIDVTATDAGGLTDTETVTISVTDVNEAPVITSGATATVAENSPTSTAVYTTTATDEDAGDTVTYSMTGTDAGSFTMTNGVVTFNVSPDYETKSSYSIDVTATDAGGLTDTETVTISVTDENDVAPVITSANAVSVQENQTAVLTVTSSDVDTMTQTFSYSLDGGADVALFSVNATTGELTFNNAPDFESPSDADADNVYEVSVKVNDGVQDSTTQTISVTVMDAGDNVPVITSGTIATIAENTVTSTAVYTTTATDADANDILVYTMAGTDAGSFTMTNGVVKFKVSPDYETKSSYSIDVIVTDLVGFTDTETVTISVTDENDVAPVITSANAVSVQENQTAVLTVTSSDVDTMTQTFSYSKVGGVDGSLFSITSGGVLTFNSAPDFESPSDADADNVYEVSVKVNDGVQDSTTQTISVTVTNVNEAPVITSGTTATIAENTVTSTAVYTTTATDVDAGDTVTYTMGGTDAGSFTITNGVVKFKASPNYETKSSYSIDVTATDAGGLTDTETVTISVTDVNEAPVITSGATATVAENSPTSTAVYTTTATDEDAGDTVTYSMTGTDAGSFTMTNGVVTFNVSPDYETKSSYSIDVIATDAGGLTDTETVTISVTDIINETDVDADYIPDDIETVIGMDPTNNDENNDGVIDGLESSTSSISDVYFNKQWHIRSLGGSVSPESNSNTIAGNDLGVLNLYRKYMGYNGGNPIHIQIVDTGVDTSHEDLVDNVDLSLSRNSDTKLMGSAPETSTSTHGTMCAGIVSARAFNGKGVRGIAPFSTLVASNWLSYQSVSELEEAWVKNDSDGKIAIASNSWGSTGAVTYTFYEDLMKVGADTLRKVNGVARGKIFVKSAGNSRLDHHDSGLHYANNNPYVITVAALANDNTHASYSSPGSNIFVSGYSGHYYNNSATIATTNVSGKSGKYGTLTWNSTEQCYVRALDGECANPTWTDDDDLNYTYGMNGTSAAAPTVAGSLALVLEACPTLNWRDVKYLTAKHAIQIDNTNASWIQNAAGFKHSVDYGFGLINPSDMIDECTSGSYSALGSSVSLTENFDPTDIPIPDNDTTGISETFTVTNNKTIEWIGLTLYSDHTYGGDLEIELTSPSGTTHRIMKGNNSGGGYSLASGFRFGSVAFYGENSQGDWTVTVKDLAAEDTGDLQSLDFTIFGY